VIDAVGVDAQRPRGGPAAARSDDEDRALDDESEQVAPERNPDEAGTWVPGDAPGQAARWAVDMVAKAGTIGIIGVYPPTVTSYPIGQAMNKNLTLKMGNCNHRRYLPELVRLVASGALDPTPLLSRWGEAEDAIDAYAHFDRRERGWTKVALSMAPRDSVPTGTGADAGTGTSTTAGSPLHEQ
jgi:threonine dehydrogenase-like Zn-dependent dehydrogenase